VGFICLIIITYRFVLAFLNENKIVTISINLYGEQYLDVIALAIIWFVCLTSLFYLVKMLKQESLLKNVSFKLQKKPFVKNENHFFDLAYNIKLDKKKTSFIGYISKSYGKVMQKFKEKK
jgi:hypothetical protein